MREGPEAAEPGRLGVRSTPGMGEAAEPSEPTLTTLPERVLPRELADEAACQDRPCRGNSAVGMVG